MIKAGGKNFKTKSSLTNYCKFVLNNAEVNSILRGEWGDVLKDVLRMHEDFMEKTLGQSFEIGVRQCNVNWRNRQFYVLREDGSDTDFSYRTAISSKDKLSHLKATLRDSINEQTIAYKNKYFQENADRQGYVKCPETGLKIKKKDCHIDHFPIQFDEIIKNWAELNNLASENILLVPPPDNGTVWFMQDTELLQSFKDYHEAVATYRLVLNKVNLQRKKAKRAIF